MCTPTVKRKLCMTLRVAFLMSVIEVVQQEEFGHPGTVPALLLVLGVVLEQRWNSKDLQKTRGGTGQQQDVDPKCVCFETLHDAR